MGFVRGNIIPWGQYYIGIILRGGGEGGSTILGGNSNPLHQLHGSPNLILNSDA